jgi:hypothetical protein
VKKFLAAALAVAAMFSIAGCGDNRAHTQAVYMLVDTSGTYARQVNKATRIVSYLLATLNPGDSLAVAKVASRSFTEKDIIDKVTFDGRPSRAMLQKRAFKAKIDAFAGHTAGSAHTDITGGLLQGAEYLNETHAGIKTIVIFSDMEEDLDRGAVRDFPIKLTGIRVVALNVTKLGTDNADPRRYLSRLAHWEARVRKAGASDWVVINDLDNHMDRILGDR